MVSGPSAMARSVCAWPGWTRSSSGIWSMTPGRESPPNDRPSVPPAHLVDTALDAEDLFEHAEHLRPRLLVGVRVVGEPIHSRLIGIWIGEAVLGARIGHDFESCPRSGQFLP